MAVAGLPDGKATAGTTARDLEVSLRLEALSILVLTNCAKSGGVSIAASRHGSAENLLVRAIAYRIQELRYGGLSKATRRKLDALV